VTVAGLYHNLPEAKSAKLQGFASKALKKLLTFSDENLTSINNPNMYSLIMKALIRN